MHSRTIKASRINSRACVFHSVCRVITKAINRVIIWTMHCKSLFTAHEHVLRGLHSVHTFPNRQSELAPLQNGTGYIHMNSQVLFLLQVSSSQNRWKIQTFIVIQYFVLIIYMQCPENSGKTEICSPFKSRQAEIVPVCKGT